MAFSTIPRSKLTMTEITGVIKLTVGEYPSTTGVGQVIDDHLIDQAVDEVEAYWLIIAIVGGCLMLFWFFCCICVSTRGFKRSCKIKRCRSCCLEFKCRCC